MIKDREKSGKIDDYKKLIYFVNSELNLNLTADKPLFVHYSPRSDVSNTTSRPISNDELDASKNSILTFEKKLLKEINGQVLYVLKKLRNLYMRKIKEFIGRKIQRVNLKNVFFQNIITGILAL